MAVWDALIIYRELDLLELRLRVLNDVVDHFVVVEATSTFTGLPKPLNFRAAEARFAPWADKIVYIPVDLDPHAETAWDREHAQRFAIRKGLVGMADDDLLLVGDVDEIPRPHIVQHLGKNLDVPTRLVQRQTVYRANWVLPVPWELGPFACRGSQTDNPMAAHMLGVPFPRWGLYKEPLLPDAGWHFSFLGHTEDVGTKLASYSHQEENRERDHDRGNFERLFRFRIDVPGRNLLTVQSEAELDTIQRTLYDIRPDYFDFSPSPAMLRRRAARSWTWARRMPRFAHRRKLVSWGDKRIDSAGPLASPFAAGLALVDQARDVRRRHVTRDDFIAQKRGYVLPPVPRVETER